MTRLRRDIKRASKGALLLQDELDDDSARLQHVPCASVATDATINASAIICTQRKLSLREGLDNESDKSAVVCEVVFSCVQLMRYIDCTVLL